MIVRVLVIDEQVDTCHQQDAKPHDDANDQEDIRHRVELLQGGVLLSEPEKTENDIWRHQHRDWYVDGSNTKCHNNHNDHAATQKVWSLRPACFAGGESLLCSMTSCLFDTARILARLQDPKRSSPVRRKIDIDERSTQLLCNCYVVLLYSLTFLSIQIKFNENSQHK